jgi:hypothetical protein
MVRLALAILLGALGLLLLATSLFADDGSIAVTPEVPADTTESSPAAFTVLPGRFDLESHLQNKPNPWKSVFLSGIYPGLGQLKNGSWSKSTAFIVIGSLLVANVVVESQRAERYKNLTYENQDSEDALYYYDQYSSHLERRDSFTWWTVGFWALNLLDAYVGGHLYSFSKQ